MIYYLTRAFYKHKAQEIYSLYYKYKNRVINYYHSKFIYEVNDIGLIGMFRVIGSEYCYGAWAKEYIIATALECEEGRLALAQAMVEPIKRSLNYQAIGRKLIMPQGALARYERDVASVAFVTKYMIASHWGTLRHAFKYRIMRCCRVTERDTMLNWHYGFWGGPHLKGAIIDVWKYELKNGRWLKNFWGKYVSDKVKELPILDVDDGGAY